MIAYIFLGNVVTRPRSQEECLFHVFQVVFNYLGELTKYEYHGRRWTTIIHIFKFLHAVDFDSHIRQIKGQTTLFSIGTY